MSAYANTTSAAMVRRSVTIVTRSVPPPCSRISYEIPSVLPRLAAAITARDGTSAREWAVLSEGDRLATSRLLGCGDRVAGDDHVLHRVPHRLEESHLLRVGASLGTAVDDVPELNPHRVAGEEAGINGLQQVASLGHRRVDRIHHQVAARDGFGRNLLH